MLTRDQIRSMWKDPKRDRFPIEHAWGSAGAGILIICDEDRTFLALRRSLGQFSFPGYWSIPGGGVSEGYVTPVKVQYIFRTFTHHISKKEKDTINSMIKLDTKENDTYDWIPIDPIPKDRDPKFWRYAIMERLPFNKVAGMISKAIVDGVMWNGHPFHPGLAYAAVQL